VGVGVGALCDCVPRVCGGGGDCAGGNVPLGAVPALSWCKEVSLGGIHNIIIICIGIYIKHSNLRACRYRHRYA